MSKVAPRMHVSCALLVALVLASGAAMARPGDESPAAESAQASVEGQLEELGNTLKAAVISGAMSEEDAIKVYFTMAERLKANGAGGAGQGGKAGADDTGSRKRDIMLAAPRPERIRMLFRPEFLRRDLPLLREGLDLDGDQMMIAQVLLDNYLEAYDLASAPLREALPRYQRTTTDQWIVAAIERVRVPDADAVAERVERAVERWGTAKEGEEEAASAQRRVKAEAWAEQMVEVTRTMGERLASLRDRVASELADLEDAEITAEDLVRMAERLRADRAQLRTDITESLAAIATEPQRGEKSARLDTAMAQIRIGQLLPLGRLSGESINLRAALIEGGRRQADRPDRTDAMAFAEAMLRTRAPWIAGMLDARTKATIDRELAGLEFQARRERIAAATGAPAYEVEARRLSGALQPYAEAVRRELASSVSVRDALLALLDESAASLDEAHPDSDLATRFREAALRRGFPAEMQRRWSERAVTAALRLDDLGDEAQEALLALQSDTEARLRELRDDAVARRILRDPELAREQIEARFGDADSKIGVGPELWLGMNHEAFSKIDDHVEDQLRGILTPEQIDALPTRKRARALGAGKGQRGGKGKGKVRGTSSTGSGGK